MAQNDLPVDWSTTELMQAWSAVDEKSFAKKGGIIEQLTMAGPMDELPLVGGFGPLGNRNVSSTFPVKPKILGSYTSSEFPAADVVIHHVKDGFQIHVGGQARGPVEISEAVSRINAQELHKRLVEALRADRDKQMPTWGTF
jgi:hypothetical protein